MNVLIISSSEKSASVIEEMVARFNILTTKTANSEKIANEILLEQDFDLIIINSPIIGSKTDKFAIEIAQNFWGQVILIETKENIQNTTKGTENFGIITIAKPISKTLFSSVINVAKATNVRLNIFKEQNKRLTRQIDDIKYIDRAKCILISSINMSEKDAHKYIEKQAMDFRVSKREIAEKILKTYEN